MRIKGDEAPLPQVPPGWSLALHEILIIFIIKLYTKVYAYAQVIYIYGAVFQFNLF